MIAKLKLIDKGILFMLLSAFIGALNGAVAKILSGKHGSYRNSVLQKLIGCYDNTL